MRKECPECFGRGMIESLDGDGYGSEVFCDNCNGLGWIDDPDSERDIKED